IKASRRSKLGDYKYFRETKSHQITIDRELTPEAFFFVLTHEIAHMLVRLNHPSTVKSHGVEWKTIFGNLLRESVEIYSKEMQPTILRHAKSPKASLGADKELRQKMFLKEVEIEKLLDNLEDRQKFR